MHHRGVKWSVWRIATMAPATCWGRWSVRPDFISSIARAPHRAPMCRSGSPGCCTPWPPASRAMASNGGPSALLRTESPTLTTGTNGDDTLTNRGRNRLCCDNSSRPRRSPLSVSPCVASLISSAKPCERQQSFAQQNLRASRQPSASLSARRVALLVLPTCCRTYHGI
jgi:hypothetical protein